jgi:hypothetical protein
VVYLCLEDHENEVRRAFRQLGTVADDPIRLFIGGADPNHSVHGLKELIGEHNPVLVVIDTLGKFLTIRDFNDYGAVNQILEPVLRVVRESQCHVLFTHHAPKNDRGGGDDVLGSTAFFGNVDTVVKMKKQPNGARIVSAEQQRYGADLPPTTLILDPDTGWMRPTEVAPAAPRPARIRAAILESFAFGEKTQAEIRDCVTGRSEDILTALAELETDGEILRSGRGVRGDPIRYSRPDESDSVPCSHPIKEPDSERNPEGRQGPARADNGPRPAANRSHPDPGLNPDSAENEVEK